ncbi:MAG: three-Cys-motif partner protein TcmP [Nitrospiraceae bacterium]|nr:MAG: three-Cys-motif partner protein TcmP [Nitrospiraceae bacterium]
MQMGQTKDFFKEKKPWSIFKDRILDYYLVPYISKILRTGKPLVIFDCFAGKGKFDDGENGSPVIIAEHIRAAIQKQPFVNGFFIEKKYSEDLKSNLKNYPNTNILAGAFEDNLKNILSMDRNNNVFLYVDPYGIKSLNLNNFHQIKNNNFFTLELLMNFNSAGFLREGCRLLKFEDLFKDDEITDYESDEDINTIEKMDAIAGGAYWQEILKNYYSGTIDIHRAEEQFIGKYKEKIKEVFRYTVNIPIKIRSSHLPKYRLFFGSNHEDGLILMADNMNRKWKEMLAKERNKQGVLFEFEFPDLTLLKGFDIYQDILASLPSTGGKVSLKKVIVNLIMKYGITFSEKEYKQKIKEMENTALYIDRNPTLTPKTKKPATSMNYDDYQISLRKKI